MTKLQKSSQQSPDSSVLRLDSRLLSAEEVAAMTGLSVETLAQWRSQGRGIPYIKISRNCVRYRLCDLDGWISERIVRTDENQFDRR
jgi:predicted DNA-binding transcriptional regulator AlpA